MKISNTLKDEMQELTKLKQNMRLLHAFFAFLSFDSIASSEYILPGASKYALRCSGGDHKPLCS